MTETPTNSPYTAVFEASRPALEDLATQFNQHAATVKSAGNPQDQMNEVLSTSDDENVKNYRTLREELENNIAEILEQIETYAREHLIQKGDVDVEAEKAAADALKAQHKALTNGFKTLPGGEEFISTLSPLVGYGRNTSATGTQQRERYAKIEVKSASDSDDNYREIFEDVAVVKDGKPTGEFKRVVTYSVLARKLTKELGKKVDVATIYEHSNASKSNDGRPFEYALSVPQANGESSINLMVRATPQNAE